MFSTPEGGRIGENKEVAEANVLATPSYTVLEKWPLVNGVTLGQQCGEFQLRKQANDHKSGPKILSFSCEYQKHRFFRNIIPKCMNACVIVFFIEIC